MTTQDDVILALEHRVTQLEAENHRLQSVLGFLQDDSAITLAQKLLDQLNVGAAVIDMDFRLLAFNALFRDAVAQFTGDSLTVGQNMLVMKDTVDFLHVITPQNWQAMLNGEVDELNFKLTVPVSDGSAHKVYEVQCKPLSDESGEIYAGAVISYDITAQHRAEAALRNQELRLITALRHAPVAVFNQNLDLRYTWVYNPQAGFPPDGALGKRDADLLANTDEVAMLDAIKREVIGQARGVRQEVQLSLVDGEAYFDLTTEPRYDPQGKLVGVTCAVVDVTQIRRMQSQLDEAAQREQQAEEERRFLEAQGNFLRMIAHDIKAPLAVISASQSLLQKYDDRLTTAKRLEHLERIRRQVDYMDELIDDVLDYNRLDRDMHTLRLRTIDLASFTHEVLDSFRLNNQAGLHRFVFESDDSTVQCLADEILLNRMMHNLLSNAVRYSPEGGDIRLAVRTFPDYAEIIVSDQGIGISTEDQARLFEPFWRGSNVGEIIGTGLGLTVVYQSARLHGGDVQVQSEIGKGTVFTITLPLNPEPPPVTG